MERVAFCIDATRERIPCMLNPEHLVIERCAGLRERSVPGGVITGRGVSDDPVQFTGGGRTELDLRLLFDVDLFADEAGAVRPLDVRDLTNRVQRLAENTDSAGRYAAPPVVRLIWGTAWNIPGVVLAVAERFEAFDHLGRPRRSLLRMLLRRVAEPPLPAGDVRPMPRLDLVPPDAFDPPPATDPASALDRVLQATTAEDERLDLVALRRTGRPRDWRGIAEASDIDDPLRIAAGTMLRIPAAAAGSAAASAARALASAIAGSIERAPASSGDAPRAGAAP